MDNQEEGLVKTISNITASSLTSELPDHDLLNQEKDIEMIKMQEKKTRQKEIKITAPYFS